MQVLESENIETAKPGDSLVNNPDLTGLESSLYVATGVDAQKIRYGYSIGSFHFMVPDSTTSEIIQNPQVFRLPKSPQWIHGLINVRGNIIPVMDMHGVLQVNRDKNRTQHVFLIDKGSNALAVLIDELPGSLMCTDHKSSIHSLPDSIIGFCESGYKNSEGEWHEFNILQYFKSLSGT